MACRTVARADFRMELVRELDNLGVLVHAKERPGIRDSDDDRECCNKREIAFHHGRHLRIFVCSLNQKLKRTKPRTSLL